MTTLTAHAEPSVAQSIRNVPALKRIMVHVDRDERSRHRIEVASQLAVRFGGRLTGVCLIASLPTVFAAGEVPAAFWIENERLAQEDADIAMRRYLDQVTRRGLQGEWHHVRDGGVSALARMARYMDLTVVSQVYPEVPEAAVTLRPEDVVLGSGRPVLVVPFIGSPPNPGSRVVIAWDGSREAARAVSDALPILAQAQDVWIVSIDANKGAVSGGAKPADDLPAFLADHSIAAKPQNLVADGLSGADALLSRIADLGADLLVMGCYGHTRLREFILGGMTREILRHMTVPVLMSH